MAEVLALWLREDSYDLEVPDTTLMEVVLNR